MAKKSTYEKVANKIINNALVRPLSLLSATGVIVGNRIIDKKERKKNLKDEIKKLNKWGYNYLKIK